MGLIIVGGGSGSLPVVALADIGYLVYPVALTDVSYA